MLYKGGRGRGLVPVMRLSSCICPWRPPAASSAVSFVLRKDEAHLILLADQTTKLPPDGLFFYRGSDISIQQCEIYNNVRYIFTKVLVTGMTACTRTRFGPDLPALGHHRPRLLVLRAARPRRWSWRGLLAATCLCKPNAGIVC